MRQPTNPVRRAQQILGRVTTMAVLCDVSVTTIYNWINAGRIDNAAHAVLVAEATAAKGQPISVRALAGLEPARRRRAA